MTGAAAVRVLVVDDQRLIREGIASLLDIQPGVAVVGTAADGAEALEQAALLTPDVVLMDVRMPVMDGVAAAEALRRRSPQCRVLMLTTFDDEEYVIQALRAGASGYLLKDLPAADLARAVLLAHAGVDQHDPSVTGRLVAALDRATAPPAPGTVAPGPAGPGPAGPGPAGPGTVTPGPAVPGPAGPGPAVPGPAVPGPAVPGPAVPGPAGPGLTGRELDVLRLVASGATNREIAERLFLSEGTVKNHVSNILSRLGLRDRTQAAIYARDHHLL